MKLGPHLHRLGNDIVASYLIDTDEGITLVDAGLPGHWNDLQRELDAVPATHSCAQQKPWCGRCAKCIYVWMQYVAWLPADTVEQCLTTNLFDLPENRSILRKMLGLEGYKPTDCVGTVSEARLAFASCSSIAFSSNGKACSSSSTSYCSRSAFESFFGRSDLIIAWPKSWYSAATW